MTLVVVVIFALLAVIGVGLAMVLRRLSSQDQLPVTAEWINELSADRYRPMVRLLDADDLRFLRAQPGFNRTMESRLRAQRCQIFRGYLGCLDSDFQRTCSALKLLMAQSQYDRPDLASALMKAQIGFTCGLAAVEFKLALYRMGIGSVDVRGLLKVFDGMRIELRTLVPAAAGSMA